MPENNLNTELSRLDSLDDKKDKKISVVEGREEELTDTFIKKSEDLFDKVAELEDEDPLKNSIKADTVNYLKGIDGSNIEQNENEFRAKVDGFIAKVELRIEIQLKVEQLDATSHWGSLLGIGVISNGYKKSLLSGKEISENSIMDLENYVNKSGETAKKYMTAVSYFMEDKMPMPENNDVMAKFIDANTVEGILTGGLKNSTELLMKFEEIAKTAQEKREECESFEKDFKDIVQQSKVSGQILKLSEDREGIIDMFMVLIEQKKLDPKTVLSKIENVLKISELNDISNEGWQNTTEAKIFLIGAVLREGNKEELKKIQAELFAEKIFKDAENKISAELNAKNDEAKKIGEEINAFKKKYTVGGAFYSNLLLDRATSTSVMGENGEMVETNAKGNFTQFFEMEKNLDSQKAELLKLQINLFKNTSLYSSALIEIEKKGNLSLDNLKKNVGEIFKKETVSNPRIASAQAELSSIEFKLKAKKDLAKELQYRQALEKGEEIKDPKMKEYAASQDEKEIQNLSDINENLRKQTESVPGEVSSIIGKYGSLANVPPEEKDFVAYKLNSLMMLSKKSMKFLAAEKGKRVEMLLLGGEDVKDPKINELESEFSKQEGVVAQIEAFANIEPQVYSIDSSMAEGNSLILGQLNSKISPKLNTAMEGLVKESQEVGWYLNSQMPAEMKERERWGRGIYDLLETATNKITGMEDAILNGRKLLESSKEDLLKEKQSITGIFAQRPELIQIRNNLIDKVIAGIDNVLNNEFSDAQLAEVRKMKDKIQEEKDEIGWRVIKTAVVFAGTIALSIATAGIAGAAAGRLCQFLVLGQRATHIVKFVSANVGLAAASSVGSRLMQESTAFMPGKNWGENVDWSAGAIAMDFGKSLALTTCVSGAGILTGRMIAAHTLKKTGLTIEELSEAGLSRIGMLQKVLNPFGEVQGKGMGVIGKLRNAGHKVAAETAQEGLEEGGESIHPAIGYAMAVINAAHGHSVNTSVPKFGTSLKDIGVRIDEISNRVEFTQPSAQEFQVVLMDSARREGIQLQSQIREDDSLEVTFDNGERQVFYPGFRTAEFDLLPDRDEEIQAQESSSQSLPLETRHNSFGIPILEGEERFFRHAETRDDEMSIPYSKIEAMAAVIKKFNKMSKTELEESSSEELFVKLTDGIELTPNQKELVKKRVLQMKQNVETAKQAIESPEVFANMIFRSQVGASGDLSVKLDHPVEVRIGERKLPSHIVLILEETDFLRLHEDIKEPWGSLDQDRQEVLKQTTIGGIALDLPGFNGNITVITRKTKMGHNGPYEGVIDHEEIHHINKIFGIRNESLVNRKAKDQYLATGDYDKYLEGAFAEQMAWSKDEILAFYRQGYPASLIIEMLEGPHGYSGVLTDAFSRIHEDYKSERITRTRFEDLKKQIDIYEKAYKARLRQLIDAAEDIMFESNNGYEILMATPMEWWGGVRNRLLNNTESVFESNSSTDEMDVE